MVDARAWLRKKHLKAYFAHQGIRVENHLDGKLVSDDDRAFEYLARHMRNEYGNVAKHSFLRCVDDFIKKHAGTGEGFSVSVDLLGDTKKITFKWVWK